MKDTGSEDRTRNPGTPMRYDVWNDALHEKIFLSESNRVWYTIIDPQADSELPGLIWQCDEEPEPPH